MLYSLYSTRPSVAAVRLEAENRRVLVFNVLPPQRVVLVLLGGPVVPLVTLVRDHFDCPVHSRGIRRREVESAVS